MTPETQARELLAAEYEIEGFKEAVEGLRKGVYAIGLFGRIDKAAIRAIVAALQSTALAERETVVKWVREQKDRDGKPFAGLPAVARAIERGDHLPQRGEAEDG